MPSIRRRRRWPICHRRSGAHWPTGSPPSLSAAEPALLVVAGMSLNSEAMIQAAAHIASALGKRSARNCADRLVAIPESNTVGLGLIGGLTLSGGFPDAVQDGEAETVLLLENDLTRRVDRR
ncbi:MAG: hypothetical protein MPW15_02025 [Candidatus Manganitrophus sp.]|nr:hypothetical protein [Candidatus Manganitrophus sp.]